jgi:hypothetical protein
MRDCATERIGGLCYSKLGECGDTAANSRHHDVFAEVDSARALLHVGFQTTALRTVFVIDFRFAAVDFGLRSMRELSNDD